MRKAESPGWLWVGAHELTQDGCVRVPRRAKRPFALRAQRARLLLDLPQPPWISSSACWCFGQGLFFWAGDFGECEQINKPVRSHDGRSVLLRQRCWLALPANSSGKRGPGANPCKVNSDTVTPKSGATPKATAGGQGGDAPFVTCKARRASPRRGTRTQPPSVLRRCSLQGKPESNPASCAADRRKESCRKLIPVVTLLPAAKPTALWP